MPSVAVSLINSPAISLVARSKKANSCGFVSYVCRRHSIIPMPHDSRRCMRRGIRKLRRITHSE